MGSLKCGSTVTMGEHHHGHGGGEVVSQQTIIYGFIANYLVWVAFALVMWMSFFPLLALRRMPARALNWFTRKIGLTESFRFTTILIMLAAVMLALEFSNQTNKNKSYYRCKQTGHSADNCTSLLGQKWRAERNFWLVGFNFLCWLMVDRLAERIKVEETYSAFLESIGKAQDYAGYAAVQRTASIQDGQKRD